MRANNHKFSIEMKHAWVMRQSTLKVDVLKLVQVMRYIKHMHHKESNSILMLERAYKHP